MSKARVLRYRRKNSTIELWKDHFSQKEMRHQNRSLCVHRVCQATEKTANGRAPLAKIRLETPCPVHYELPRVLVRATIEPATSRSTTNWASAVIGTIYANTILILNFTLKKKKNSKFTSHHCARRWRVQFDVIKWGHAHWRRGCLSKHHFVLGYRFRHSCHLRCASYSLESWTSRSKSSLCRASRRVSEDVLIIFIIVD